MALKIILPLHEFIENLVNRSALFFFNVDRPNPVTRNDARLIVDKLIDDALNHAFRWAPSTDAVTGLLEDRYPWMTTHVVFASRFYQECIDPIDARLTEILHRYVPRQTNDVWNVTRHHDDIILENLGSHDDTSGLDFHGRLQALLTEQFREEEQRLPAHRANATTSDDLRVQLAARHSELTNDVLRLIIDKDLNLTGQPQ